MFNFAGSFQGHRYILRYALASEGYGGANICSANLPTVGSVMKKKWF